MKASTAPGQLSRGGKSCFFLCCMITQRQETKEQDSLDAEQTLPSKSALSWLRWLYVEAPGASLISSLAEPAMSIPHPCCWGGAGTSQHTMLHPTRNLLWERSVSKFEILESSYTGIIFFFSGTE